MLGQIVLLDGAVGQELTHRGRGERDPLWSTAVMARDPDMVGALHEEYFAVGARVATTNTYSVLRDRLIGSSLEERMDELAALACQQVSRALKRFPGRRVAGALGPLGQSYRPDLTFDVEDVLRDYRPVVDALQDVADFFLVETISSCAYAEVVSTALSQMTDTPFWLSFSVDDQDGTRLRSGEPLNAIGDVLGNAEAVLLNCSRPEAITDGLESMANIGLPFGAYANGFSEIPRSYLIDAPSVDLLTIREDLGPQAYADAALSWVDMGATIVGGCCEVGPEHIRVLHNALISKGHEVV